MYRPCADDFEPTPSEGSAEPIRIKRRKTSGDRKHEMTAMLARREARRSPGFGHRRRRAGLLMAAREEGLI